MFVKLVNKVKKALKNPNLIIVFILNLKIFRVVPDKIYLRILYKLHMKKRLNLDNPLTFNEKLQWLKLYNRRPEYTKYVDKYEVRSYISEKIGEEYLIPLIGIYNTFNDIDFNKLPNQFVLKCTHDSGGIIICRNKSKLDFKAARKKINKCMRRNYYFYGREWPYKNIKPRIICEKYMEDESGTGLIDYKFMCFNGQADCVMVCIDRYNLDPKFYFFDEEWNLLRYNIASINVPKDFSIKKPDNIKKMFEIARKLSSGLPFVRVDLYNVHGKIYFGELTFFPQCGFDSNLLKETDLLFGEKIDLNTVID